MKERDFQMYLNFEQHKLADRFFQQMDPEILEGLAHNQRKDIMRALVRSFLSPGQKIVDLRWSFSFFKKKYYIQFFLGPESRKGEPRYYNRYLSRSRWFPNTLFILLAFGILFSAAVGIERILQWFF